ncbi:transmembrane protein 208 [Condylostylus longicornis]|uniref:transmembrane protein 208 n=1 Tax=Condylostylus longicornis TaxID=2530218 RepID=UPI00244DF49C|nr:transmembrane protein 208 [Condylostylus longicornis]
MAVQKGKQGTKGAKQIIEENSATIKFYRNMMAGSVLLYVSINLVFFQFTTFLAVMSVLSFAILFAAFQFMNFMSQPKLSETGTVIDSGTDLNMQGGIAENVKDLIILTCGTLVLTLLSNYFWLTLLLIPIRAVWMLWGSVIKPWLQQKNEEPEVDEKKQKKMERKMRRMR